MKGLFVAVFAAGLLALSARAALVETSDGVFVNDGTPVSCPGLIADGYCWYKTTQGLSWAASKSRCEEVPGSQLATIDSDFQRQISSDSAVGGGSTRWIGLSLTHLGNNVPKQAEGVSAIRSFWDQNALWVDGSTSSYRAWSNGEPNNAGNKPESCAHIWKSDNSWNDEGCTRNYAALCRFPTNLKCGRRRYISWGDPHYTSWDGLKFDYQGKGLFTTCKNSQWEVTSCHVPWRGNQNAAVQRAMHIALTDNNAAILAPSSNNNNAFTWFVNGSPISLLVDGVYVFSGGESLKREDATTYVLKTKDGYLFHFQARGTSHIDYRWFNFGVTNGADVEGICGSPDCDPSNDFKGRDGTVYPVDQANSFQLSSNSWYTTDNPFLGISQYFTCPTAGVDPPSPAPPAPPTVPDCSAQGLSADDQAICDCCERKTGGTSGTEFDGCVFDLVLSDNPTADCELVPDESCGECFGTCNMGECVCPNGRLPPLCEAECCTDREVFEGVCQTPTPQCSTDRNGKETCSAASPTHKVVFKITE